MQTITFGTDGIRGNADSYPFTSAALFNLGCAIAHWAQEHYQKTSPKLLICGDTRISRQRIKHDLLAGISKFPVTIVTAGVLPTPALCRLMTDDQSYDVGIVISASHNPYHDNGIKIFGKDGYKLSTHEEALIVCNYQQYIQNNNYVQRKDYAQVFTWQTAAQTYQDLVSSYFTPRYLDGLTIVLDCAYGATAAVAPLIFKSLGARVITLADSPDGFNINEQSGALHPGKLQREVIAWKADIGFAFDGDGDRVIAVNKHGYIKDGDDILYQMLALPEYEQERAIVGTVMTNQGFEYALDGLGKQLLRTMVGDKHVVACLEKEQLALGGESSGHVILRNHLPTCDAIFIALMLIKSLKYAQNWDFETFEKFPQVLVNVPVACKKDLADQPYRTIIEEYEQLLEQGRVLVRYSGTENLLRVMTEAQSFEHAQHVAQTLAAKLQQELSFE